MEGKDSSHKASCISCKSTVSKLKKLICGCLICANLCEENFSIDLLTNAAKNQGEFNHNDMKCNSCNYVYKLIDLIDLNNSLEPSQLREKIVKLITYIFHNFCMECRSSKRLNESQVPSMVKTLKEEKICAFLKSKNFEHYCCNNCYKIKSSQCSICECYHLRIMK